MKIVHVVPHIHEKVAGSSYSVPLPCQSLVECGNEIELICLAAKGPIPSVSVDVYAQWPVLDRFAVSSAATQARRNKACSLDVVHNHSLWSMLNLAAGWVVPGRRAKLVTSPRGTLSPWALSHCKYAKRLLWPLQRRALARADFLHATREVEYEEFRLLGFRVPVTFPEPDSPQEGSGAAIARLLNAVYRGTGRQSVPPWNESANAMNAE